MEKYEYDVYGKFVIKDASDEVLSESGVGNPYFFTGRRYDSDSGLYYYRARYYSVELGKFLQVDPIEYDAMNLYSYCMNDPINWIDPEGEVVLTTGLAIGGVTLAALVALIYIDPIEVPPTNLGELLLEPSNNNLYNPPSHSPLFDLLEKGISPLFDLIEGICSFSAKKDVDKNKEPNHPDFKPHKKKKGLQKIPWDKNKKGYPDNKGNYWEPVSDGHKGSHEQHWDVQRPDGSHTPMYPPK